MCHIRTPTFCALLPVKHSRPLIQNLLQMLTAGHVRAPLGSLTAPLDALMYWESASGLSVQAPGGSPWAIVDCFDACLAPSGTMKTMEMTEALEMLRTMLDKNENIDETQNPML